MMGTYHMSFMATEHKNPYSIRSQLQKSDNRRPPRLDGGRLGARLELIREATLAAVLAILMEGHL